MKKLLYVLISVMLVGAFFGCGDNNSNETISGIELENMDKSIHPQDDFYSYVNGSWLEKTEIPSDKSSYSAFTEVYDKTEHDLQEIMKDISSKTLEQRSFK